MRLPTEIIDLGSTRSQFVSHFIGCISPERSMNPMLVVIALKLEQLSLQIYGIPE
jgi:hypothetical protein